MGMRLSLRIAQKRRLLIGARLAPLHAGTGVSRKHANLTPPLDGRTLLHCVAGSMTRIRGGSRPHSRQPPRTSFSSLGSAAEQLPGPGSGTQQGASAAAARCSLRAGSRRPRLSTSIDKD